MEKEKGATTTDKAAHRLFDNITAYNLPAFNYGQHCGHCGAKLETQYHEERLYSVHCPACKTITLIKAPDPASAERWVAYADRIYTLQQTVDAYQNGDMYELLINMLVDAVPQLVEAIVERLPELVEAAVNAAAEKIQEA